MLRFLICLCALSNTALAQTSPTCAAAVQQGKNNCSQAIQTVNNYGVGSSSSGDSLGLGAALMRSQSQTRADGLTSAQSYCQNQIKTCQSSCSGSSTGTVSVQQPSNTGNFRQCDDSEVNTNTDSTGLIQVTVKKGHNCIFDPLVLQLAPAGEAPQELALTNFIDGVWFDIMGWSQPPLKEVKGRISWFQPNSRRDNYFLVLPDANGEVVDIRQMFGNATPGPDRQLASDGFAALAKYDDHADGFIDAQDQVFASLRLWSDLNGDGIAQPTELFSLAQKQIKTIDLHYDPGFAEIDDLGNEIKYKSTVTTEDGQLSLIYDVWFALAGN